MSDQDQCCEIPLSDLARNVPIDLRGEWEIQWAEDGTPTGHEMAPVGAYVHRLADEIARLEAENTRYRELIKRGVPLMAQDGDIDGDTRLDWVLEAQEALNNE